jgi:hypothetical protein
VAACWHRLKHSPTETWEWGQYDDRSRMTVRLTRTIYSKWHVEWCYPGSTYEEAIVLDDYQTETAKRRAIACAVKAVYAALDKATLAVRDFEREVREVL